MKSKFRIVESDKFYYQRKTLFGWRYVHDDNFQEGWQVFFVIAGLIGAVLTIISVIVNIIFYNQGKPAMIPLTIVFVVVTILMFLGMNILRNYKREYSSSVDSAKSHIDIIILQEEASIRDKQLRKLQRREKREKRKKKKFHYLDIKTERKEKLKRIK